MDEILTYSPVILTIIVFLIQQRLVVTPEQLEKNTEKFCMIQKRGLPVCKQ